jgi:hypothetical protein
MSVLPEIFELLSRLVAARENAQGAVCSNCIKMLQRRTQNKANKKRDSSPLTHFCRQDADFGRKSWPHKDYLRIYTLAGVSRSY